MFSGYYLPRWKEFFARLNRRSTRDAFDRAPLRGDLHAGSSSGRTVAVSTRPARAAIPSRSPAGCSPQYRQPLASQPYTARPGS